MGPQLTAPQVAALQALHKALDALTAAEGKGGPSLAALTNAINAEAVVTYKTLLGIPAK